jgi:glycerate-2-kinase
VLLVSGGASSLLEDPAVPPRDYAAAMRTLVKAGLSIEELNAVRKHLSNAKGGRLALEAAARGVSVVALLLTDVPSNRLDSIGSGLSAADPTTFGDALSAVKRFSERLPSSVVQRLRDGTRGRVPETPKPGLLPFARVTNAVVASNETAREVMRLAAERHRYRVVTIREPLVGEAWLAGQNFARRLLANRRKTPLCLIAGGETTVRVRGRGRGGRNQEFALGAATVLDGSRAVVAAFGTDGVDGSSANAGAVADGRTIEMAQSRGLDPERVFARSDSATFFEMVGGAVRTGPTGTNVADIVVGLRW